MWNNIARGISEIGYALKLGGGGISRPLGSAYMPGMTPEKVYATNEAVSSNTPNVQDVANSYRETSTTPNNQSIAPRQQTTTNNTNNANNSNNTNNTNNDPGFSAPQGPSDSELNDIYNPIFANLDAQKSSLESAKLSDLGLIDQSQADAEALLLKQREANKGEFDASNQTLNQQKLSALAEAVKNYNALKQQSMSRFGASSSAGQATQELANQEFLKQQGLTDQTATAELGKLLRANVQANLFYDQEEARIKREAALQKSEISKGYIQAIMQIETNRSMAQSEKAARKLAEKQRYNDAVTAINNQVASNRLALSTWKEQQTFLTNQGIQKAQSDFEASLKTAGDVNFENDQTTTIGPSLSYGNGQGYAYNYNPNIKSREDEINSLLFS